MPYHLRKDSRRETVMANLQITSQKIGQDLKQIGIYPQKTWSLKIDKILTNIPTRLYWAFFLGYFDGDGSITEPQTKRICDTSISYVAPWPTIQTFYNILANFGIIGSSQISTNNKYSQPFGSLNFINTTSKYLFLKFIYHKDIPCLTRKKLRSKDFLKKVESNCSNRAENKKALEEYSSVVVKWEELLEG